MANVKFFSGKEIPLEMHKVRIVQKLSLPPVEERLPINPKVSSEILAEYLDFEIGKSGNMIWFGTADGIKAAN